ncbi:Predicted permease, DMT superfamily [Comamonas testosteroni]|uniref:Predicted permease, DMT superfamily n=1 Tax=Comamonas testosteroni TaxID=285 RepID=A0A8B4SB65_COMTE|nr:Predicted permease, DMT superfamily [Comamonas testosteroni]
MSQHSAPSVHRHTLTGIGFTVLACACFSILDTGSKYAGALLPLLMALWLRYALQSALTVGFGVARHGLDIFHTRRPGFQFLRAILFCLSNALAMLSLRYLPLAEFTAIVALTPLALTLLAALWLGQQVSPLRWVLVALALRARWSSCGRAAASSAAGPWSGLRCSCWPTPPIRF